MNDSASNANPLAETIIRAGEKIPGFDIRKSLAEVDGDAEAWLEVIRVFIDTTPGLLEALKTQCEEKDVDLDPEYTVTVHGIKGVCYTIGAMGAGDKARELELRSKAGDAAFVRDNNGNLVSIIEKLISDLAKLREQIPRGAT